MLHTNDLTSNAHEIAVVHVHTWAGVTHPARGDEPATSWVDSLHGPALEGVFLSTQGLVVLLVGLIGVALVMAARAAGAAETANPTARTSTHPAAHASHAGGR